MEKIKILFFVLGTLLGNENSQIAAEKTTVTINPITKSIAIEQEGLFALIRTKDDSLNVSRELKNDICGEVIWCPELADYKEKYYQMYAGDNGMLNVRIYLEYNTKDDLKAYGLYFSPEGFFSMMDFPRDNLTTGDGMLKGQYWHFKGDKVFTFCLEPYRVISEEALPYKKNLLPIWRRIDK